MHINFAKISVKFNWKEKIINKIIATKDCNNNKDNKVLNQVLKNQDVEWFNNVKKAKGVSNTKTFTIT